MHAHRIRGNSKRPLRALGGVMAIVLVVAGASLVSRILAPGADSAAGAPRATAVGSARAAADAGGAANAGGYLRAANAGGTSSATNAAGSPGASGGANSGATNAVGAPGAPAAAGSTPSSPGGAWTPFPSGLLVADRGNGRILILDSRGRVAWRFPTAGSLPAGQSFSADDAFITPDLKRIVANDEFHQVVDVIDIATHRIVWQYGRYGVAGSGPGELHTPDDAYPLPNGDISVADIRNCRVIEIAPDKRIVHTVGRLGRCADGPPTLLDNPNGDTPLPDGGLLVTDITGSRVIRLAADGHVVFDIHVPVAYPSDAQLDAQGNVVVADFSTFGQVIAVNPATGRLVWRWAPGSGPGRLDHPSLATPLPGGLVSVNDDFRHRVVVIDPAHGRVVWQFGRTGIAGRSAGLLNTPDGHQPLPPGFTVPATSG